MVTDEYRPYIGGAGRSIELFAEELSRLGHTVAIATAWHADAPAFEDDGEVQIHRIRDLPSRMRWISEDPDEAHAASVSRPGGRLAPAPPDQRLPSPTSSPPTAGSPHSAAAALIGKRIPLVIWAHDYGNVCAMRTLVRGTEVCSGPAPREVPGLRGRRPGGRRRARWPPRASSASVRCCGERRPPSTASATTSSRCWTATSTSRACRPW